MNALSIDKPDRQSEAAIAIICLAAATLALIRAIAGHLIMPDFVPIKIAPFADPIHWFAWLMLSPPIAFVLRNNAFGRVPVARVAAAHTATVVLLAFVVGTIQAWLSYRLMVAFDVAPGRGARLLWNPLVAIPVSSLAAAWDYIVIVGLVSALRYRDDARTRERRAVELEGHLTIARLETLRSQLHPHFLFNVLHASAVLAVKNGAAARDMLLRLSDFLRWTLSADRRLEVPLSEELDMLDRYLAIERMRFADRLSVEYDVDVDALDCLLPGLILQPIVENAVRHGISKRAKAGSVIIRARVNGHRLQLFVDDDGPGVATNDALEKATGQGLANVRARLTTSYGNDSELSFTSPVTGGLSVSIVLPERRVRA